MDFSKLKTLKISKSVHKKMCSNMSVINPEVFILGFSIQSSIVEDCILLGNMGGCGNFSGVDAHELSAASIRLYQRNLIPIGFSRVGSGIFRRSENPQSAEYKYYFFIEQPDCVIVTVEPQGSYADFVYNKGRSLKKMTLEII